MDHMRISGTEPSPVILSQTVKLKQLKSDDKKCLNKLTKKGLCHEPTQINSIWACPNQKGDYGNFGKFWCEYLSFRLLYTYHIFSNLSFLSPYGSFHVIGHPSCQFIVIIHAFNLSRHILQLILFRFIRVLPYT